MIKDIGTKITEGLDKFYKAFQKQKVLKTMEEVEANTDEENLASALLLSELNNKLRGISKIQSGTVDFTIGYNKTTRINITFPEKFEKIPTVVCQIRRAGYESHTHGVLSTVTAETALFLAVSTSSDNVNTNCTLHWIAIG